MFYTPLPNKTRILAQKAPVVTQKGLRWLTIISSIPLFGIVTAFGIAPTTSSLQDIPVRQIIHSLPLPEIAVTNEDENQYSVSTFWHQENIRRGDTIAAILSRLEVNKQDKADFIRAVRDNKVMQHLRSGEIVHAETSTEGELLTLRYFNIQGKQLNIGKIGNFYEIDNETAEANARIRVGSGVIQNTLFAATDAAGLPNGIAAKIVEIFASDIDFYRDLQKGDRFTVVYESLQDYGSTIQSGRVLAVEFINKGKPYRAVYFQEPGGEGDYYTPNGENLRKPFLRTPLEFSRISSGFTNARFHPILKQWRAHKGIDYAAPTGTPVMATADGVVEFKGWQNGYGNMIILKHRGEYSSAYGHLSSFGRGLQKERRIKQGEIIGYVGSTGMATGPHLHYELRVNGIQRDPSQVIMPAALSISKRNKAMFQKETKELIARLDLLRNTNFASAK